MCTSEKEQVSKSSVLRKTTDSHEERRLLNVIYEYFRATGSCEGVQELSDLYNIHSQNDDVQDSDARWDQSLLAASEI